MIVRPAARTSQSARCLNLWGLGGIATAASPCSSPAISSTNCRSCADDSCSSKAAGLRTNSPANRSGSRLSSLAGRSVSRNVRRSRLWIRPLSFILILPAVNLFNSDFMKVSGKTGSVSVLDFLAGEFVVQNMLMLPMAVLAYLVAGAIYTPVALQTVVTIALYILYIARFDYASGTLLPAAGADIASDAASIAGILCAGVVTILVVAALATRFSTGSTRARTTPCTSM